jgi:aryl-phospho-beta-D-glucosidase BglC (GH1 family)
MFKFSNVNSPRLINGVLSELIGPDKTREFWNDYLDNYITAADIHFLKKIGANSIRIPFTYKLFTSEEYLGSTDSTRGFRLLDRVIGYCRKEGLYVILDMHAAPGGQTGDNIDDSWGYPYLYENEKSQELTVAIWQKIAARYHNETAVMGYDLLNEPIAHYFDKEKLNPMLEPLYKRIMSAVRIVDKNHLFFLEGAQWGSNFKIFHPSDDPKVVYSFHKYWSDTTQKVIQEYLDFRDKYNVPLYLGESGENKNEWITSFRALLERNDVGWHFWPYKKMDSQSSVITFRQPDNYQKIVDYSQTTRNGFQEVRKAAIGDREEISSILKMMITNSRFENCIPNNGYIKALGFKAE